MPHDPRSFVWDARQAIAHLRSFVGDKSWEDYESDVLLRSGVERQFEIIGEALNRLSKAAPDEAVRVDDLPRIVAFRNILIHGYAVVDDRVVWEVATTRLDRLDASLVEIEDSVGE
jgi:uncharacterized protein with HEPN domain